MEYLPTFSDQLDVDYISNHGILMYKNTLTKPQVNGLLKSVFRA